jgi:3-oxoadipate enol-lactonase
VAEARINGWNINYRETGGGFPVLCIHGGFGGPQGAFLPPMPYFVPALGDGFRIIEYDRRNCRLSEMREAAYTQDDIAAEAAGLLDHLGLDRALIVGDSMGGTIAQSFALAFPQRVVALALVETSAHMHEAPFYGPLKGMVTLADAEGADAVFERRRKAIYEPQLPPNIASLPEERRLALQAQMDEVGARLRSVEEAQVKQAALGELCNWRAHATYDTRSRLRELARHRTLVLHGDADTTVPTDHGRELAASIPGAELSLIAGGQHAILNWPDARTALRSWALRIAAGG